MSEMDSMSSVRRTADDASISKLSAVEKGYYEDEYVQYFAVKQIKKPPIINKGYYARVFTFRMIQERFIEFMNTRAQMVILGCGYDTSYFELLRKDLDAGVVYFELDFDVQIERKAHIIENTPALRELLDASYQRRNDGSLSFEEARRDWGFDYGNYKLVSVDLREPELTLRKLQEASLDDSLPTLLLSECVLVYLEDEHVGALLRAFTETLSDVGFVSYDMISPDDRFGRVMVENLHAIRCSPLGMVARPTLASQLERCSDAGFQVSVSSTMRTIFEQFLPPEERLRTQSLEWLDEVEEWNLIMEHYCLTVAYKTEQTEQEQGATERTEEKEGDQNPAGSLFKGFLWSLERMEEWATERRL